jgi:hypothetical protein
MSGKILIFNSPPPPRLSTILGKETLISGEMLSANASGNATLHAPLLYTHFPIGEFVCADSEKVGTDPTFSQ